MEIGISLERTHSLRDSDDDVIFTVAQDARIKAIQKTGRIPTLTELLYNTAEDKVLSIRQFLFGENDANIVRN